MNFTGPAFSRDRFLTDISATAEVLGAPYDESLTRTVVDAFAEGFSTGALMLKTTDRPRDSLGFRLYPRRRLNVTGRAVAAGLLDPGDPLLPALKGWAASNRGATEYSCDFDADSGLVSTRVHFDTPRPLQEVLTAPGVPGSLRLYVDTFRHFGLAQVRFASVDHGRDTLAICFGVQGPVTPSGASAITALSGAAAPSEDTVADLARFLPRQSYSLALTVRASTGVIQRITFAAPGLPAEEMPELGPRLAAFYATAPSYDAVAVNAAGWSFGALEGTHRKGARSYCGDLAGLFQRWAGVVGSGEARDPAVSAATP
ncbi:aromatic prenyltransferase [Actinacidiphila rubida]|uniref:Aromatic prenyltransferase Orf2 n=1 Tax=Actinacidiphila rubida TaxID=310780 RepID=A0A1H8KIV0_9ACTN|nr:aromatic prenyltransferase [Actinacidiphila rubida]SEN92814.1 Aromatic prenyltransferase Orf2 [Actinacidiphila rubida]